jgi:hypothetical protein
MSSKIRKYLKYNCIYKYKYYALYEFKIPKILHCNIYFFNIFILFYTDNVQFTITIIIIV